MSLIENALKKAKTDARSVVDPTHSNVGMAGRGRVPGRRRQLVLSEQDISEAASQARQRKTAEFRQSAMEDSGVLLGTEDEAALRTYKILRTRIQHRLIDNGWHSIGVTSALPGDGKTLTAINLAISLARDVGTYVFLVDMDLQRPTVCRYFGMDFFAGISDYLEGVANFDDILYSVGVDRLTVVPNRVAIDGSSDVLGAPQMQRLIKELNGETPRHIIIYDLPPVLVSDDVIKFGSHMDSVLFVVSEGHTPRSAVPRAVEALGGMNILGVALNKSNETQADLYY
ncbi:MAG: CpsD/CapB family tyrosine-protein kinase [Steroidobacteraceae bacterium]